MVPLLSTANALQCRVLLCLLNRPQQVDHTRPPLRVATTCKRASMVFLHTVSRSTQHWPSASSSTWNLSLVHVLERELGAASRPPKASRATESLLCPEPRESVRRCRGFRALRSSLGPSVAGRSSPSGRRQSPGPARTPQSVRALPINGSSRRTGRGLVKEPLQQSRHVTLQVDTSLPNGPSDCRDGFLADDGTSRAGETPSGRPRPAPVSGERERETAASGAARAQSVGRWGSGAHVGGRGGRPQAARPRLPAP